MITEAQKRAKAKYRSNKVKHFTIELSPADSEVIEHLNSDEIVREGKATYIKRLIREDIERQKHS